MQKATIIGIVLAVFIIAGAVFGSAALFQDSGSAPTEKATVSTAASEPCPCGCGGQCDGNCGNPACTCGKNAAGAGAAADTATCGAAGCGCGGSCGGTCGAAGCGCGRK